VFLAAKQAGARWRLLPGEAPPTPAASPRRTGPSVPGRTTGTTGTTGTEQASYREAAAVLDRERHDLITAAGRQFRIVRAG
jgi:hypothetical protein